MGYLQRWSNQSFSGKHTIAGLWVAVVLSVAQIGLTIAVAVAAYRLQDLAIQMQRHSHQLQVAQFLEQQNRENEARVRDAIAAVRGTAAAGATVAQHSP